MLNGDGQIGDIYSIGSMGAVAELENIDQTLYIPNEFDQVLIDSANDFFEVFGETGAYRHNKGDARVIDLIVNRHPPSKIGGAPHGTAPNLTVVVRNDSTEGISGVEIDLGLDEVFIPVRMGQAPQWRRIAAINKEDAAMLTLEIR